MNTRNDVVGRQARSVRVVCSRFFGRVRASGAPAPVAWACVSYGRCALHLHLALVLLLAIFTLAAASFRTHRQSRGDGGVQVSLLFCTFMYAFQSCRSIKSSRQEFTLATSGLHLQLCNPSFVNTQNEVVGRQVRSARMVPVIGSVSQHHFALVLLRTIHLGGSNVLRTHDQSSSDDGGSPVSLLCCSFVWAFQLLLSLTLLDVK